MLINTPVKERRLSISTMMFSSGARHMSVYTGRFSQYLYIRPQISFILGKNEVFTVFMAFSFGFLLVW